MSIGLATSALPAVLLSAYRATIIGFQWFMLLQMALVASLLSLWLFRTKLSYYVRVYGILSVLFVATFTALSQLGPVADSKVFMVFYSLVAILFLSRKVALAAIGFIIVMMALFSALAVNGFFSFQVDYGKYATGAIPWALTTWNMSVFSAMIGLLIKKMMDVIVEKSHLATQLSEQQEKIANNVPGMLYQFVLRLDGSSYFPYASDGINDIFQISAEKVKNDASPVFNTIHPDDANRLRHSIVLSAKSMKPWSSEYRIITKEGLVKWLSGRSAPEKLSDGSTLWHGIILDVTDKKLAENVKSDFVATVSHELRTPLTSISGALKLIDSGVVELGSTQFKSLIRMAEKNSAKLLYLINDLLDIEKLEQGEFELVFGEIDLVRFIENCVAQNQAYAKEFGTHIEIKTVQQAVFDGDKQRLHQALTNLLSNACKYSSSGKPVEVGCYIELGRINIYVQDYGEGIPEEFVSRLFDKFTQADSSTTRKVGGTGLGLSIVKRIVELHGGKVFVKNVKDAGACFTIELPLIQN